VSAEGELVNSLLPTVAYRPALSHEVIALLPRQWVEVATVSMLLQPASWAVASPMPYFLSRSPGFVWTMYNAHQTEHNKPVHGGCFKNEPAQNPS